MITSYLGRKTSSVEKKGHLQALWTVLLLAVLVAGCATSGVNRGDVNVVSMEEEWQLGAQLERDLDRQLDIVRDRSVNAYVSGIGQRIVRQTGLANRPWEFHVVDDPAINAFNIPGGHVYVNTGLINAVDNVSELAGVMAHEVSHGIARHATERLTKSYGLNVGAGLLLGRNPALYEQILAQVVGTGAIAKFSRDDEREADRLGVRYMHSARYNPEGMITMFEKLLRERERRPSAVSQFFSTHPLAEDRIEGIREQVQSLSSAGLTTRDGQLRSIQQRTRR